MRAFLQFQVLAVSIISMLAASCSALYSPFDKITPVHMQGQEISSAVTPHGFVVSVAEIHDIVPLTKTGWNIYADKKNYYLSSSIQKMTSKTGDNSWLAGKNGIVISGTDRRDIEILQKEARNKRVGGRTGRYLSEFRIREALNQQR